MQPRPVLIVSPEQDLHVGAVSTALKRRGVPVVLADFANLGAQLQLALELDHTVSVRLFRDTGKVLSFSDIRSVWWRRPRCPRNNLGLDEDTTSFVRGEWEHFIEGLEAFTKVRWINSPASNRLASRKAFQLAAAKAVGLRVPRTCITNSPEAVLSLTSEGNPLVYKRIGPAPKPLTATKDLLPSDIQRLDTLVNCPAIFQEHVDARYDIRVTVVGAELYATEIHSQVGASRLDWRFDHTVPFLPHTLDTDTSVRLRALMARLNLVYGAIDLRLTPEGEYVFLEVNPGGQYLFVELLAGLPISESLANYLAGEDDNRL